MVKNLLANAGDARDAGLIPDWGISPGVGNRNPLQYSYLKNPVAGGAWWATVQRVVWHRYNVFYNFFLHLYIFDYLK